MSIRILTLAFVLFQTTALLAATNKEVVKHAPFEPSKFSVTSWNEEEAAVQMKSSEKKRKPANSSMIDESMMSKELKAIEARVHATKSSEGWDVLLTELDKNYESYPTDVKFYITQIMPTKAFRGFFFRLKPLFDGKSNFVHSQILTTAKKLSTRAQVFLPYDHAEAGFEFISSPYVEADGSMVKGFTTETDVQEWIVKELLPLINISAQRLEKLNLVDPIVWDEKMAFGSQSFADGINRFKMVGEFEKNVSISGYYSALAGMATIRAYSIQNTVALYKDIGFLYGLDGFGLFNKIDGVSADKISKVIKKPAFANTGTLMPDGAKWMEYAYHMTQKSLKRLSMAWELSSNERKDENLYVFNTGFINVNRDEVEQNLQILNRVVMSKNTETLRSGVTGEVVQINYSKLFMTPPADMKVFLPTTFDKKPNASREVTLANGTKKTLTYRNFAEGSATGWDLKQFEAYFPSVKSNDDVYRTVRVINSVQGNWLTLR
ncbi:MAG: hypothetical protein H7177_12480 [Rhizobacter sp.]|nr:hypothetical protein [Bacteriovorax sp.]